MFIKLYKFILIAVLFSCSSGKNKYDFSVFEGDNAHSPFSSVEFPDELIRKNLDFPADIISIYKYNQDILIVCNSGDIYTIDFENSAYDLFISLDENISTTFFDNKKNLFLLNSSNKLLKVDLSLKTTQWEINSEFSEQSEIVFHKKNFIVLNDSNVLIIDNENGNIINRISNIFSYTENIYPLIDDDKLYIPTSRGEILCYDLDDFKLIWKYSNNDFYPIIATPAIYSDYIYFFSASGILSKIDKENGMLKNTYNIFPASNYTYLAINEDNVFISSFNDFFIIFSLTENKIIWEYRQLNGKFIVFKNSVILNCFDKILKISKTGEILKSFNVETERIYYIDNELFSVFKNILNIYK